ncbi:hypothetical protein AB0L42_43465 [Streptomyces sp. NPDC052287]|uniref:hypothetical protein n=1 Tax=Streptomyces sp. NPDC052287 TaxID=3154950 RepID=UPI00342F8E08
MHDGLPATPAGREERQLTVRALLDGPYDRNDLAPYLDVTPQRVSDIASGHRNSAGLARKARAQA